MVTKKKPHRWSGAGYVCIACGHIKDTCGPAVRWCDGPDPLYDLWLYHVGSGWRIDSKGVGAATAAAALTEKLDEGQVIGGVVVAAGVWFDLFTKEKPCPTPPLARSRPES